jgi:hypothetical protein
MITSGHVRDTVHVVLGFVEVEMNATLAHRLQQFLDGTSNLDFLTPP